MDVRWNWFRGGRNYFFRKWRPPPISPRSFHSTLVRSWFPPTRTLSFSASFTVVPCLQGAVPIVYAVAEEVLFLTVTWELNSILCYIYRYSLKLVSPWRNDGMIEDHEYSYFFGIFQKIVRACFFQRILSSGG